MKNEILKNDYKSLHLAIEKRALSDEEFSSLCYTMLIYLGIASRDAVIDGQYINYNYGKPYSIKCVYGHGKKDVRCIRAFMKDSRVCYKKQSGTEYFFFTNCDVSENVDALCAKQEINLYDRFTLRYFLKIAINNFKKVLDTYKCKQEQIAPELIQPVSWEEIGFCKCKDKSSSKDLNIEEIDMIASDVFDD